MHLSEDFHRRVSVVIDSRLGLHYTESRRGELNQGLERAARESGIVSIGDFVAKLESRDCPPRYIDALTRHIAIGETYFFRHSDQFRQLETTILPGLIQARKDQAARSGDRPRLDIWSAACSTGEETWSIAISLRRVLHTLADWDITIIGTDVNQESLRVARHGEYGEWSFRSVPAKIRESYFEKLDKERERIKREILPSVTFHYLNFFDTHTRLPPGLDWKPDIVFCRNVLYYFSPERIRSVLALISGFMADDGWLFVGPSESFAVREAGFVFAGGETASIFRVPGYTSSHDPDPPDCRTVLTRVAFSKAPVASNTSPQGSPRTGGVYIPERGSGVIDGAVSAGQNPGSSLAGSEGRARVTVETDATASPALPAAVAACPDTGENGAFAEAIRLANLGLYRAARIHCEAAIAENRLDPDRRYISGVVHMEAGEHAEAAADFRRALSLDPGHIMARYLLASLVMQGGNRTKAATIFGICLEHLNRIDPASLVPWSEGLDAGSLAAGIRAMSTVEAGNES